MTTLLVGADGGIGRAVRARLEAINETVIGLDRSTGVDAADPAAVERFLAGQPPIDSLIHVAGTVNKGTFASHSLDDWKRILDDNLTTVFVTLKAVLPGMQERKKGSIVLTSSTAGRTGGSHLTGPAYAAAKGAIVNLTRYLAVEYSADGIRANCIAPGLVDTKMLSPLSADEIQSFVGRTPIPRLIPPDEIAAAILYLVSDAATSITGITLDINGGRHLP